MTRLYHYTTPEGLIGILENRSLWAVRKCSNRSLRCPIRAFQPTLVLLLQFIQILFTEGEGKDDLKGASFSFLTRASDFTFHELDKAFADIIKDLRTQYLIGYYAPRRGADTSFRSIKLNLVDPSLAAKFNLRYRNGYYADAH